MGTYTQFALEGMLLGLGLAVLLGPIFIALTQTSIEKGGKAGIIVATGIWVSDILIAFSAYYFIHQISEIVNDGTFNYWMGLAGGFILIVFGISAMVKKVELNYQQESFSAKSYFNFWLKGFLVNAVNPFTFVFWLGVMSTYVIGKNVNLKETMVFIISIISVIIITDSLKVVLAKVLRKKLTGSSIQWFIRGAGMLLLVFGILLIYRTS